METLISLASNKKVIGFGLIVAASCGIVFSYYAESSFYIIKGLNLSPSNYGLTFMLIAVASMSGGLLSQKLNNHISSETIMEYGIYITTISTFIFSSFVLANHYFYPMDIHIMIGITIASQMSCAFGNSMTASNALALALEDYKHAIGTATSLFGFFITL